jgi:hypothetical protein
MNDRDLSEAYDCIHEYLNDGDDLIIPNKKFCFSLTMALTAIDKQIPKFPIGSLNEYSCPVCHNFFEYKEEYCCQCGQKILWRES